MFWRFAKWIRDSACAIAPVKECFNDRQHAIEKGLCLTPREGVAARGGIGKAGIEVRSWQKEFSAQPGGKPPACGRLFLALLLGFLARFACLPDRCPDERRQGRPAERYQRGAAGRCPGTTGKSVECGPGHENLLSGGAKSPHRRGSARVGPGSLRGPDVLV